MAAVRRRWAEAAFSTRPLRVEEAGAAVAAAYRAAGLEPPEVVLTAGSPLGGALIAAALDIATVGGDGVSAGEYVGPQLNSGVIDAVTEALGAQRVSPRRVAAIDWNAAKVEIWKPLVNRVRRSLLVPLLAMNRENNDDFAEDLAQGAVLAAAFAAQADALDRHFGTGEPEAETLHAIARAAVGSWPDLDEDFSDDLHDHFHEQFSRSVPGGMEVHILAYLEHFQAFDGIDQRADDIAGLCGVARESGPWWPFARVAVLTDHPEVLHTDRNGRLHSADGPAIVYRDGWQLYAWHGRFIPLRAILRDWKIGELLGDYGLDEDAKRCALERLGWDWLLEQTGTTPLATAEDPDQPGGHIELYELPGDLTEILVSGDAYGDVEFDVYSARFLVYTAEGRRVGLAVDGGYDDPIEAAASLPEWADAEFGSRAARD
jgi:hypothetical protein